MAVDLPQGIEKVGEISEEVKNILGLSVDVGMPIYIGPSNIVHMEQEHPGVYRKYFHRLSEMLSSPDYVGVNSKDGSIEYIKAMGQYLKIAVRISSDGFLFVRSMYPITRNTVLKRERAGALKRLTKSK